MEKFDCISDQIITWANKSETETDGRTLIQVIRLVFEKATDEVAWSEMYARLCRKMVEKIRASVQGDGIKNNEGRPIAGGQLFRKYLLNRCQEGFERGWAAKDAAAAKAGEDDTLKAANDKNKDAPGDELTRSVTLRMQCMLQDVVELRDRKWTTRNVVAAVPLPRRATFPTFNKAAPMSFGRTSVFAKGKEGAK
ncbi:ARM repeat-containing protein, partial [Athelia psychrophila]